MLERAVSGEQTGADQAGWRAARACGLKPWNSIQVSRVIERTGS
jgi:hypothetical protein